MLGREGRLRWGLGLDSVGERGGETRRSPFGVCFQSAPAAVFVYVVDVCLPTAEETEALRDALLMPWAHLLLNPRPVCNSLLIGERHAFFVGLQTGGVCPPLR